MAASTTPTAIRHPHALYSEAVAEDRHIRLAGYEVFRFGGYELAQHDANTLLTAFFDDLLDRYDLPITEPDTP